MDLDSAMGACTKSSSSIEWLSQIVRGSKRAFDDLDALGCECINLGV